MELNRNYIFAAVAAVMLVLTGCKDELLGGQGVKKYTGDEIVFGGRAGFEISGASAQKAATRTVYTGAQYEENGKTYEGVHWVADDKVRIYSPEAAGVNPADYTVSIDENEPTSASLTKIGDGALQWGSTTEGYTFYAMYPSPEQYTPSGISASDVLNGDHFVKGVIPSVQPHLGIVEAATPVDNDDFKEANANNTYMANAIENMSSVHHIVKPDMKYAYMVAKTVAGTPDKMGNVYLDFMPIATAVEVTLRNLAWKENVSDGQTFNLTSIVISSRGGEALSGCFKADLSTMGVETDSYGNGSATAYPTDVQISNAVATSSSISLPMYSNGANGDPLELKFGDAVTFTVFVLPTADIDDINITINGLQGTRTGALNGIKIEKHKKTYLRSVPITGDVLPFDFKSWIQWIDDDVLLRSLSIPGSGGAATYMLTKDGTVGGTTVKADMVRQQNYSIEKQWGAGVRCFELSVDVNGTSTTGNLGDSKIICSGLELNYTLRQAVDEIRSLLLQVPNEFAMVIVTYETKGGWYTSKSGGGYTSNRNPSLFMSQLNNYWNEVDKHQDWKDKNDELSGLGSPITTGTVLYNPQNTTIGNARGKLFCIARPTSINVDYGDYVLYDPFVNGSYNTGDGTYKWALNGLSNKAEILGNHGTQKIARPEVPCHEDILIIHGWGNDKDKWGQRGFSRNSVRRTLCNDQSLWSEFSFKSSYPSLEWIHTVTTLPKGTEVVYEGVEYTITAERDGRPGRPFDTSKMSTNKNNGSDKLTYNGANYYGSLAVAEHYAYDPDELEVDFTYETSAGIDAWVQEWARVSPASTSYTLSSGVSGLIYAAFWSESYEEKFKRVCETLQMAQQKAKGDIVYINSLSGYYITNDYPQSQQPCSNVDASVFWMWNGEISTPSSTSTTAGMGGDIAGFSAKINKDFYDYLLGIDTDYEAGSMGIVLIDRVGDGDAGENIPGIIIANNFQFDLDAEVNSVFGLYDAVNEGAALAPANRNEIIQEPTIIWE